MNYNNLVISILILMAAGYVYNKFKINQNIDDNYQELSIIKKYLLNEQDEVTLNKISSTKKPTIWIHIDYDINSRKWESFGSRNNSNLNQDYLYLTLRSIINKCGNTFNIVLINDDSFKILLENYNIDLNLLSNPQKCYYRKLSLAKILYKYGGILMSPSFILFKSLNKIYKKVLDTKKICVIEFENKSSNSHTIKYMPNMNFIACIKNCPKIYDFINHLEILISKDYTSEIDFEDSINKWFFNYMKNNKINTIDGSIFGVKDNNNKLIGLDRLLGTSYIELNNNCYGIFIPKDDLLKRNCYNWFVYLNTNEVLNSNTNIAKYLLLSNE